MTHIQQTKYWQELENHFQNIQNISLKKIFKDSNKNSNNRAKEFSICWQDFFFDFSKHRIDKKTISLFCSLAEEISFEKKKTEMFQGEKINWTEDRAVLHTLLRNGLLREKKSSESKKENSEQRNFFTKEIPLEEIKNTLNQMKLFSEKIILGEKKGSSGKQITDIVNIGIGGSDLGPRMVDHAMHHYKKEGNVNLHFLSNVDGHQFKRIVKNLSPETTLFIVASKSFTTTETMCNATSAKQWLLNHYCDEKCIKDHVVAISTNIESVIHFGIAKENIFTMWDFVGGRYSVWSAIGLSLCCCYGYDFFCDFLEGAYQADIHFQETPLEKNIPFLMAILSIWYNNFFHWETQAILVYDDSLRYFPSYLQQLEMESNGKKVNYFGEKVDYQTGPIIWGGAGTDGQHAYFQLLHQGKKNVPCDFISFVNPLHSLEEHHLQLLSNFFAQTKALAFGIEDEEKEKELANFSKEKANLLRPHKDFEGNIPSSTFLIDKMTPQSLGKLIAFYEHKVFVQGIFFQINSFDQWGVELGKKYAKNILKELKENSLKNSLKGKNDSSTHLLLEEYCKRKN